jgi:hypothetical protein
VLFKQNAQNKTPLKITKTADWAVLKLLKIGMGFYLWILTPEKGMKRDRNEGDV